MNKRGDIIVLIVCIVLFLGVNVLLIFTKQLEVSGDGIGVMIAAGITLAIYSFLYKDNPAFKIAENLYVGAALGYTIMIMWYNVLKPELFDPLIRPVFTAAPLRWRNLVLIVPAILGVFMLTRFSQKLSWLSRWAFAFIVGMGAGLSIPRTITSFILKQIEPTLQPIFTGDAGFLASINLLVILIGVFSVLIYFFFSIEHKGPIEKISKVGIWFLMVSFGASFGYTVMARMSLFIGRVHFLLQDWLGIQLP